MAGLLIVWIGGGWEEEETEVWLGNLVFILLCLDGCGCEWGVRWNCDVLVIELLERAPCETLRMAKFLV